MFSAWTLAGIIVPGLFIFAFLVGWIVNLVRADIIQQKTISDMINARGVNWLARRVTELNDQAQGFEAQIEALREEKR